MLSVSGKYSRAITSIDNCLLLPQFLLQIYIPVVSHNDSAYSFFNLILTPPSPHLKIHIYFSHIPLSQEFLQELYGMIDFSIVGM